MSTLDDLKTETAGLREDVGSLTSAVNAEQEQVTSAIKKLEDVIAAGNNEPVLQEVLTDLKAGRAELQAAIADIKTTIADEPAPGEEPQP